MNKKIIVSNTVNAETQKVWDYYTNPEHITQWNFADPSWHYPSASNELKIGGKYVARMEAKDESFGFDFEAIYTEMNIGKSFTYEFGGRTSQVVFNDLGNKTEVVVTFEPEEENPVDIQQAGWQSILNNFKRYVEGS